MLYKTTIVLWTDFHTVGSSVLSLGDCVDSGDASCSKFLCEPVERPEEDPDWDNSDFLTDDEDDESDVWQCKGCSWLVMDNEGENGMDGWIEQDDGTIASETPCPRCGGVMLKWPDED